MLKSCGHETIVAGPEPGSLDSAIYSDKFVQEALLTVEGGAVRFMVAGENPVEETKLGHLLPDGATFRINGPDIVALRFIQSGTTAPTLNVTYFNKA